MAPLLPRLGTSLWTDETLTAWVISGSFAEVIERSLHYQGQSPFYFLCLKAWSLAAGSAPWALRIPSLLCLAVATLAIFHAARSRVSRETQLALLVLVPWHAASGLADPTSARPSVFAFLWATLAILQALRWVAAPRRRHAAGCMIFLAAAVYAHALYALAGLVVAYILLAGNSGPPRAARWRTLAGITAGTLVLAAPLAAQLAALAGKQQLYSYAAEPGAGDLLLECFPLRVLIPLGAALIAARGALPGALKTGPRYSLAWSVLPFLALALLSWLTPASVFVQRYAGYAVGGHVLLVAAAIDAFSSGPRRYAAMALALGVSVMGGIPYPGSGEDWRGACARASALTASTRLPVVLSSSLAECKDPAWTSDPRHRAYLSAPLTVHGMPEPAVILPVDPERALVPLPAEGFVLVLRDPEGAAFSSHAAFRTLAKNAGWHIEELQSHRGPILTMIVRPGSSGGGGGVRPLESGHRDP